MFKKIILIGIVIAALAGYENFFGNKPKNSPNYVPKQKIEQNDDSATAKQMKEFALRYLPDKDTWPEPCRVMYYMVYMDEIINPIKKRADYLPLDSIGMDLQHAVIAVEDHNFYQHNAVSWEGIIRAMMINASAGEVLQGGSTLTQQLVKNLFLTSEQTISRKVQEALLATVMESKYSKDQILELYLNSTYFGMNCYGVNSASDKLFGKAPIILRLEEAALLAGLPNAPSHLNPFINPKGAKERQEIVLDTMQSFGFITQNQCWKAKSATIDLRNGSSIIHEDHIAL